MFVYWYCLLSWPQQSWTQLGVEACTGSFQVASTCGDSYVLPRTRHSMMMMMMSAKLSCVELSGRRSQEQENVTATLGHC